MPLISIVIPAYNMAEYISDALISCINQTYQNIEIIVIDDGSKDKTKEVIKKFQKSLSYHYQENMGVSVARNHGINIAKGEFVAFLDADDIWMPTKIEAQIDIIEKNNDLKAVSCGYGIMDEAGKILMPGLIRANYKSRDHLYKALSICQLIPGSASGVLVERKFLNEVGLFNEQLFIGEDWDLWLRIVEKTNIYFINKILVYLRSRTKKEPLRSLSNEIHQVQKIIENSVTLKYKKRAFAALYARVGSSYMSANEIDNAISLLIKSFKNRPFPVFPLDFKDKYKYPKYSRGYLLAKAFLQKGMSAVK